VEITFPFLYWAWASILRKQDTPLKKLNLMEFTNNKGVCTLSINQWERLEKFNQPYKTLVRNYKDDELLEHITKVVS
jgi:hypothetical protein